MNSCYVLSYVYQSSENLPKNEQKLYLRFKKIYISGTIAVCANLNDKGYFGSLIKVNTCYHVRRYICEDAEKHMASVIHEAPIEVGKASMFEHICDDGFPCYYFDL